MTDQPKPLRYLVMKLADAPMWGVFVRHDETPDWYRLIASFVSQDRADSYVEIENDFATWEDAPLRDDEKPRAEPPTEPKSSITVERITHTITAERVTETPSAPKEISVSASSIKQIEAKPAPEGITLAPPAVGGNRADNPSKETNADRVLKALKALMKDGAPFPMWGALALEACVAKGSLGQALDELERRGAVVRDDRGLRQLAGAVEPARVVAAAMEVKRIVEPAEEPFIRPPTRAQLMAGR